MIKFAPPAIWSHVGSAPEPIVPLPALRPAPAASAPPRLRSSADVQALIIAQYEFLWRSLRRLGVRGPAVEDAAQQVLLVFGRRIDEIQPGAERGFLFATATRVAADYRKKQMRSREVFDPEAIDLSADSSVPADELIDQGRARDLADAILGKMPIDIRSVFILFELEDMTMAQIAKLLEIAPGTVASRLRRGREIFAAEAARLTRPRTP